MNFMLRSLVIISAIVVIFACKGKTGGIDEYIVAPKCVVGNSTATCSRPGDVKAADLAKLRSDTLQLFEANCASCHARGAALGGFADALNLDTLVKPGNKYIRVGAPEASLLFQRLTDQKQPMPPKGALPQDKIDIVRRWIAAEGLVAQPSVRERISLKQVFRTIRADFDRQQDRLNLRYVHFAHLWNAGVAEEEIQLQREALSKLLNMLSTRQNIVKPTAIDGKALIFRIDLAQYGMENANGLAAPVDQLMRIGRWKEVFETRRPARDTAAQDAYFAANFVVKPSEYRGNSAPNCVSANERPYFCNPDIAWMKSVMTQPNPSQVNGDANAVLDDYVLNAGKSISFTQSDVDDVITLPNLSVSAAVDATLGFRINGANVGFSLPVKKEFPNQPYNADTNPIAFSEEHSPVPVMRGDWFVSEVASNYKQRVYYHLAGIPDDTGVLDVALGIDDEGALVRDNKPDGNNVSLKPIIMRSGFTDSGVSQNHRILERIETQQFSDKALWRSYEFLPTAQDKYQDALNYPFGPILFPSEPGDAKTPGTLGYECIDMFEDPNKLFKFLKSGNRFLLPITDWATRYWLDSPINFDQFRPTKKTVAEFNFLSAVDQKTYLKYWEFDSTNTNFIPKTAAKVGLLRGDGTLFEPLPCDSAKNGFANIRDADRAFNFHGFEYQFLRPNGLQGFATVATNAFITDFKVPSVEAFKNQSAVFATNEVGAQIVIQPLSCLSCHSRGLIPKKDQVNSYVKANVGSKFNQAQVDKADRIYVDYSAFQARLEKDNQTIKSAIEATGTTITDVEPIVFTYKKFALTRINLDTAAANVGVTPENLRKLIKLASATNANLASELSPLTAQLGTIERLVMEKYLPLLVELAAVNNYFD